MCLLHFYINVLGLFDSSRPWSREDHGSCVKYVPVFEDLPDDSAADLTQDWRSGNQHREGCGPACCSRALCAPTVGKALLLMQPRSGGDQNVLLQENDWKQFNDQHD